MKRWQIGGIIGLVYGLISYVITLILNNNLISYGILRSIASSFAYPAQLFLGVGMFLTNFILGITATKSPGYHIAWFLAILQIVIVGFLFGKIFDSKIRKERIFFIVALVIFLIILVAIFIYLLYILSGFA